MWFFFGVRLKEKVSCFVQYQFLHFVMVNDVHSTLDEILLFSFTGSCNEI